HTRQDRPKPARAPEDRPGAASACRRTSQRGARLRLPDPTATAVRPAPPCQEDMRRSSRSKGVIPDERRLTRGMQTARIAVMDPELEAFIPLFPQADLTDPANARKDLAALAATAPAPDTANMAIEDRTVPAEPDVPVRIYRPHGAQGAIVWLHGGGFVMGDLDTEHPWAARLADGSGAVVISVGYRRAPEHRYPAALNDAYAVLTWTAEHAAELGIDAERMAVGGHSSGACLAAAAALRARDHQGPRIRFQLLNQPGLDDRQQTWSARHFTQTPWMTRDKVSALWRHYLGSM